MSETFYPSDIGQFVIGFSPIGVEPSSIANAPTTVLNVIPAYPYRQYIDDAEVGAFFTAYNVYAQAYLNYLNTLNMPVYTGGNIVGPFLDWVATNLYGLRRPTLESGIGTPSEGPYDTYTYNAIPINGYKAGLQPTFFNTTDDIYKRILTWLFYKGDGKVFTPQWLKRRINRFLNGANGADVQNDQTYAISVAPTGRKAWTITLPASNPISAILQAAFATGVCELPIQISWTVNVV